MGRLTTLTGFFEAAVNSARIDDDALNRVIARGGEFQEGIGTLLEKLSRFITSEDRAIAILGKTKVVSANEVAGFWGQHEPQQALLPSEEILAQCAKENQAGKADWRLVYVLGLSLRAQREVRGVSRKKQPCFYDNKWWLEPSEDAWAARFIDPDYQLLNFKLQSTGRNWQEQEEEVGKLGDNYERANETAVAEAVQSVFMSSRERLLGATYHWGHALGSGGHCVLVGYFGADGLYVSDVLGALRDGRLGVVLARKF